MAQVDWVAVDGPTPWTGIQDFWDTRYAVDFQTIGNKPPEWSTCPRKSTIKSCEPWTGLPDIGEFHMLRKSDDELAPRFFGFAVAAVIGYILFWIALWGGVLYVALHFILKWW